MGSVLASLRSATAAAGAPEGAEEDDELEGDLGDALRSRLVALRRRRLFCRSRLSSLLIISLAVGVSFRQSSGCTQYIPLPWPRRGALAVVTLVLPAAAALAVVAAALAAAAAAHPLWLYATGLCALQEVLVVTASP